MKPNNGLKFIGTTVTILGLCITFLQKQIEAKNTEELIAREVEKQINKL